MVGNLLMGSHIHTIVDDLDNTEEDQGFSVEYMLHFLNP